MNAVKINRLELLTIVRENKEKHIAQYIESVADYKLVVLKNAKENLRLAKTEDLKEFAKIKNNPSVPVSYETSYSRAIRMLELSVEDVIEVEEDVFNQLVLDEWQWKHAFMAASTAYKMAM